jgi:hypothetical protein
MVWNRFRFQNFLLEECEVTFTLDSRNDSETAVVVSDEIKILPTASTTNPDYNPKTQILHGPFWTYTDSLATSSYQVVDKSVEAVKNELIAVAANERWIKTSNTVPVTINSTEYKFDTLAARLRELAYLNKGIRLSLTDEREAVEDGFLTEKFHSEGGLKEFVQFLDGNRQP